MGMKKKAREVPRVRMKKASKRSLLGEDEKEKGPPLQFWNCVGRRLLEFVLPLLLSVIFSNASALHKKDLM
jgi:hypothetical protein